MDFLTRRALLHLLLKSIVAVPFIGMFFQSRASVKIPPGYRLAHTDDQIPKVMKYVEIAKESEFRKDAKALCENCAQYALSSKEIVHPRDGRVAPCEAFPLPDDTKMYVKAGGWCLAHAKRK